jgi:hypothetical protein
MHDNYKYDNNDQFDQTSNHNLWHWVYDPDNTT